MTTKNQDGPPYLIEAKAVRKAFGDDVTQFEALRGVDLALGKGEFVAIMGPSGSGKSTLLHILGGVDTPTSGQVLLEGADLAALDDDQRTIIRRSRIGFIFQSFNLLSNLTAEENVSLPMELGGLSVAEARRRTADKLALVGMSHRATHLPSALSGGEQQRVAVARALAIEPVLLLADEPTGNLDSVSRTQVISLLRRLVDEHGQTIVMVTHDPTMAAYADRCVFFRDGLIDLAHGTLEPIDLTPRVDSSLRGAQT